MAVEPLFLSSMDALKAHLRLSGAAAPDALSMIDQAVQEVRVAIFDECRGIGPDRVQAILAVPLDDNPSSRDGLLRLRAANLESVWVRSILLRRMPTLFMDGQSAGLEAWNQEPLTRQSRFSVRQELQELDAQIQDHLSALRAGVTCSDRSAVVFTVFESGDPPWTPGSSIKPFTGA